MVNWQPVTGIHREAYLGPNQHDLKNTFGQAYRPNTNRGKLGVRHSLCSIHRERHQLDRDVSVIFVGTSQDQQLH